jgi:glutamine synthetase
VPGEHAKRASEEVGLDTASKNVLQQAEEQNVKFIRLWFTDILGTLKSFAITVDELEDALSGGMGFDGSSITGYQDIEESDMIAMPDHSTTSSAAPSSSTSTSGTLPVLSPSTTAATST